MRRFICLFLTLLLVFSAFSGAALAGGVVDNRKKPEAAPSFTAEDFSAEGFIYESYGTTYYYVAVTNGSQATVEIDIEGIAKDVNNKTIGADKTGIDVLGPGETAMAYLYFSGVTGVGSVEVTLSASDDPYYTPVLGNIELSQVLNNSNVTLIAANTGSITANAVRAYALFLDEQGNVLDADYTYLTDVDSEIKPGQSIAGQINFGGEYYDSVRVFLDGYSYGKVTAAPAGLTAESIEVVEYAYESYGTTNWFVSVKNLSDTAFEVEFNGIAYDSSDTPVGAASAGIDVIGPGQTSICQLYLPDVTDVARVELTPSFKTDIYYEDVLAGLSYEKTENSGNVILSVTNNGSKAAEFVEATVLFLDGEGNVVDYDNAYFTDDDNEIKPGSTITEQLNSYESYVSCEIFFEGRHYSG